MPEYTPSALAVIRQAQQEAWALGFGFIQREQLFLGLLHDETVAKVFHLMGADPQRILREIQGRLLPGMGAPETPDAIELLPTADQVYRHRALTAAALLGHTQIGPADILLGFLLEQHGLVVEVLAAHGLAKEHVIEAIHRLEG